MTLGVCSLNLRCSQCQTHSLRGPPNCFWADSENGGVEILKLLKEYTKFYLESLDLDVQGKRGWFLISLVPNKYIRIDCIHVTFILGSYLLRWGHFLWVGSINYPANHGQIIALTHILWLNENWDGYHYHEMSQECT